MAEYEHKFLVLKNADIERYLGVAIMRNVFDKCLEEIEEGRAKDGRTPNEYYVVNKDEPYADQVIDLIIEEETALEAEQL